MRSEHGDASRAGFVRSRLQRPRTSPGLHSVLTLFTQSSLRAQYQGTTSTEPPKTWNGSKSEFAARVPNNWKMDFNAARGSASPKLPHTINTERQKCKKTVLYDVRTVSGGKSAARGHSLLVYKKL